MQINQLPAKSTVADTDVLPIDDGTTQKVTVSVLGKKIAEDADPAFTSGDVADSSVTISTGWTSVTAVASGTALKTVLNRITTMMKNVRWLYKMLGTTDISSIGGGTVTGALNAFNTALSISGNMTSWEAIYSGYCQAIIKNNVVYVRGSSFGDKSIGGGDYVALTTLPEKYRPNGTYYFPVGWGGAGNVMRIETNGIVSFAGSNTSTYWIYFVAYPLL